MKLEILTSAVAVALIFTGFALASVHGSRSRGSDTPPVEEAALASFNEKRQVSDEQILQKQPSQHDRAFPGNEYAKFEMVPPTDLLVDGVAAGDLLNIRVSPRPGANIVARLNNGAVVKKLGCREIAGNKWCLVDLVVGERQTGWAAGRYLKELGEQSTNLN
jgi:Bacterial SH3 domain